MTNVTLKSNPISNYDRKLAPDLARGFMLLFIALAHAHVFLYAVDREITKVDQIVVLFRQVLVDGRAFPMFFLLFGYGMVQLMLRQEEKGNDWISIRKLFRRRGWLMILIGFLHVALLFEDIIALYGLATLLLVGFLRASDKKLLWIAGIFLVLVAIFGSLMPRGYDALVDNAVLSSIALENPFLASAIRIPEWIIYTPLLVYQVVPGMLIGILAARRRILDNPEQHLLLLVRTSMIGIGLATVGAIPLALMSSQYWTNPSFGAQTFATILHTGTGYAGGLGWAAFIGLLVIKLGEKRGPITMAIAAVGQRSMTFYIFQSVVFIAVFAPYAGGLGAHLGQAGSDVIALFTWLLSVVIAEFMRRANVRGPAETLLRKLSYRT